MKECIAIDHFSYVMCFIYLHFRFFRLAQIQIKSEIRCNDFHFRRNNQSRYNKRNVLFFCCCIVIPLFLQKQSICLCVEILQHSWLQNEKKYACMWKGKGYFHALKILFIKKKKKGKTLTTKILRHIFFLFFGGGIILCMNISHFKQQAVCR